MDKFVILDGNAIIHRAYHALPPLTTKEGLMVNAAYGFTSTLLRVIADLKPAYLAVSFDVAGPTFRHLQYQQYKATRVKADQALYDQIPLAHEIALALGLPIYEKQGYEADDVIGTVVKKMLKYDHRLEAYIVTGDMDALQLVNSHVKVYTLRKGLSDAVVYDQEAVKKRYGFGPEMMVDYKALRGDASDNIPGVPGIGEKGATELIQKVGGIDEIYQKIKKLKEYQIRESVVEKLRLGEESARMSKALAKIECDVPELDFKLEDCKLKPFAKEKITPLFRRLEFFSLLKKLTGADGGAEAGASSAQKNKKTKLRPKKEFRFREVTKLKELGELVALVDKEKQFACRAIISAPDIFTGLVVVAQNQGWYVPAEVVDRPSLEILGELFRNPSIELVGHDLKQLIKALAALGVAVTNKLFDAMIASYLLSPGSRAHDAASVLLKTLGEIAPTAAGQESLFGLDKRQLAYELYLISLAVQKLRPELADINNLGLFVTVEMPLVPVLAELELNGIAVDKVKLAELSERVKTEIDRVSKKIYRHAGQEFNIASPLQLREILFETLQIPVLGIKKGKTGLSTSAEQLEKMRGLHPIINEIENYRELAKLQNTYVDVLPTLINKTTNRIHTTLNQAVAATGRLSSSDPNLQNIPIRTALGREVREAFVAEPGNLLVSADYSQIELRIVASLAEDKKMMEIFAEDADIHTATAAAINGVPPEQVTKELRRAAKEINFGVLYGMGVYGLSWRADIPQHEAKEFIAKYFREFSGVKKYLDQTIESARKSGYCETLFGRRRYLPELMAANFQLRAAGERMAVNHPIQGTAADLMKMAMIRVSEEIKKLRNKEIDSGGTTVPSPLRRGAGGEVSPTRLVLQVHDELVLEVKKSLVDEVGAMLKKTMEGVVKLRVPVKVAVRQGANWNQLETLA